MVFRLSSGSCDRRDAVASSSCYRPWHAWQLDHALVTPRRTSSPNSGGTTFCWLWYIFTSLTCSTSWKSRRSNVLILGLSSLEARSCTYNSRNGHSELRIGGENLCLYTETQTCRSIYQEASHRRRIWAVYSHNSLEYPWTSVYLCLPQYSYSFKR